MKRSLILTALFSILAVSTAFTVGEQFWISFSGKFGAAYLLSIDASGAILVLPTKVTSPEDGQPSTEITGLSPVDINRFNLWFINKGSNSIDRKLYRRIFDSGSLEPGQLIETSVRTLKVGEITHGKRPEQQWVSVKQRTGQNAVITAFPVDNLGRVTGRKRIISPVLDPGCVRETCFGGISSDARYSLWTDVVETGPDTEEYRLYIRALNSDVRPVGQTILIDQIRSQGGIFSADVSLASENTRFVVYTKGFDPMDGPPQQLLLQRISTSTGQKLGEPQLLFSDSFLEAVRIDPHKRFVVFLAQNFQSGTHRLMYQRIDISGRKLGAARTLERENAYGGLGLLEQR